MKKIKAGFVSYLNAKPLIYPLLTGEISHNFDITLAPPAKLARMLAARELDVALVPAVEYASGFDYVILPNMAISSRGAVHSVNLYSKKPIDQINTVALDMDSRTSAMLVKILLKQKLQRQIEYIQDTPPVEGMLSKADAALIIGDNALRTPAAGLYQLDLGEEWLLATGYAFVFALFVAHESDKLGEIYQTLIKSKSLGLDEIPAIARQESEKLKIEYEICLDYLTRRIYYGLPGDKITGLKKFFALAKENNYIEKDVQLRFYQP